MSTENLYCSAGVCTCTNLYAHTFRLHHFSTTTYRIITIILQLTQLPNLWKIPGSIPGGDTNPRECCVRKGGSICCGNPAWIREAFKSQLQAFCWKYFFHPLFYSLEARCDSWGGVSYRHNCGFKKSPNGSSDEEITDRKLNERQAVFALLYNQREKTFMCHRNVIHLLLAWTFTVVQTMETLCLKVKGRGQRFLLPSSHLLWPTAATGKKKQKTDSLSARSLW